MSVEWRSVQGFDGVYEVSSDGQIRSVERTIRNRLGVSRLYQSVLLKGKVHHKTGYVMVTLRDAARSVVVHATVHALVSRAFLPPCPEGQEARHKDGVRTNNVATNLAWGTHLDNQRDQYRHGTRIASTWHHKSKLTVEQVMEIRASTRPGAEIARELGLSVSTVCRARKAKTYAVFSRSDLPALLANN